MQKLFVVAAACIAVTFLAVGFAAFAENQPNQPPTAPSVNTATSASVLACVKTAVDKRETAIQTVFSAFNASITSALQTRKTELSAAWGVAEKGARNQAIKSAWEKFKTAKRGASDTFNKARKSAWSQFTIDRKACKATSTGEDPGADMSL